MVVAGTTQIGVIEKRGRTAFLGGCVVGLAGEKGGDALAIEDAQFEGAGGDRFEASRIEAAIRAQNAQAGAEPLFGVRPTGELALIRPSVLGRSCRRSGGTDPASTRRSADGSWACGRGPCRACGPCSGAGAPRRAGRDGRPRPCAR